MINRRKFINRSIIAGLAAMLMPWRVFGDPYGDKRIVGAKPKAQFSKVCKDTDCYNCSTACGFCYD